MMILISLITAFSTVACFAARRTNQERSRAALATLLAIAGKAANHDARRVLGALTSTAVAGILAAPAATTIVMLADSQILGFHAQVNLDMILSAMGVTAVVGCVTELALYPKSLRLGIRKEVMT